MAARELDSRVKQAELGAAKVAADAAAARARVEAARERLAELLAEQAGHERARDEAQAWLAAQGPAVALARRWEEILSPVAAHPRVQNFRQRGMIFAWEVETTRGDFARWCFEEALRAELLLRPIVPADADALRRSFARLSPEEIRLRFLHPITEMTAAFARQLCELDRASAFALVVTEPLPAGEALIGAVARQKADRKPLNWGIRNANGNTTGRKNSFAVNS